MCWSLEEQGQAVEILVEQQDIRGTLSLLSIYCKVYAGLGIRVCELNNYKKILDDALQKVEKISIKHKKINSNKAGCYRDI